MATKTFVPTNGDWSDTANWGGSLPSNNDTVQVLAGGYDVTTGVTALGSVTGLTVRIGNYGGALGSSGAPITFGNTATINYNSQTIPEAYLSPSSTGNTVNVLNTSGGPNALVLGGTIATLIVDAARSLQLSSLTLTTLIASAQRMVKALVNSGSITTAYVMGGDWQSRVMPGTIYGFGGKWDNRIQSSATLSLLHMASGFLFDNNLAEAALTISSMLAYPGSKFDHSQCSNALTITAGSAFPGATLMLDNGLNNVTGALNDYAALLSAGSGLTVSRLVTKGGGLS